MCGIVGNISCGSLQELERAVNALAHRGPDDKGTQWFAGKNSGLGHTRLSIIDLSDKGHQPMYDPEAHNWIVYNGEIYNYPEIKKELEGKGIRFVSDSDTEVVLKGYRVWGADLLQKLNGMFALAIYNEETDKLFMARDRLGIKPLYFYRKARQLIFASEIKAILAFEEYKREPDLKALHTAIHYQVTPYTGFKDIYKLEAGTFAVFQDGNLHQQQYWDINPTEEEISFQDAENSLDELLSDATRLQMLADVPIGVLLSGGLDSSVISVLMQNHTNNPLNSYTIKFKEKDLKLQGNTDDSYYAAKLAKEFGFNHNEFLIEPDIVDLLPKMIWHMDEPLADPAAINTFLIASEAKKQGIKVLLTGMGADEVFSGYRSHLACLKANQYQKSPAFVRSVFESVVNKLPENGKKKSYKYNRWLKQFIRIASMPEFERQVNSKNSALDKNGFKELFSGSFPYQDSYAYKREKEYFFKYDGLAYVTKLCFCDTKIYMTDHNLTYSDKAMMAAGVEGRPPLIDHRIVEFMFRLPPKFRIKGNTQKFLLKKVAEEYLPKEIIYRSKAPFSAPMRGWLKNELKEMVHDILSEESIKKRGLYNAAYIQKLIRQNEQGIADNSQLIWRFMVNELWFRTFFS